MQIRVIYIAAIAIVAFFVGLFANRIPGFLDSGEAGVGVAYATSTTICGNTAWEISTGTSKGVCIAKDSTTDQCKDDEGNEASVDCDLNGGQGACGTVAGSGSCKLSETQPPAKK